MSKPMEIEPGTKFGRLTVIEKVEDYIGSNGKHRAQFRCTCDCGTENVIAKGTDLKCGTKQSCGCLHKESAAKVGKANTTFGISHTPEAQAYYNMKNRIFNPNYDEHDNYSGRGIKICDRWLEPNGLGLKNFYDDMSPTYFEGATLDRIDVNGDYCPENCRWATDLVQKNNMTTNRPIEFNGGVFNVTEVNRALGYSKDLVRNRLELGWSEHDAIFGKPNPRVPNPPMNAIYFEDNGRLYNEQDYEETLQKMNK